MPNERTTEDIVRRHLQKHGVPGQIIEEQTRACWDSGFSSGLGCDSSCGWTDSFDAQWAKMKPLCLGKPGDPGRRGKDNRLFIEAVLWIARTGSPWRDLPPSFGHWNSVFTRFRDWVKADIWKRLFDAVSDDPDMEYAMVDATIVKVHRHGQGAKGGLKTRRSAVRRAA